MVASFSNRRWYGTFESVSTSEAFADPYAYSVVGPDRGGAPASSKLGCQEDLRPIAQGSSAHSSAQAANDYQVAAQAEVCNSAAPVGPSRSATLPACAD